MISSLLSLVRYDLLSIKNWYSTRVTVKALVTVLFLMIFSILFGLIYFYCYLLFDNLRHYDSYGQFVAKYLMVSSVVFLLVFTTLTTALSSILSTYSSSQSFKKLMIFPVTNMVLASYYYIRFLGASVISSLVLILPIFSSYAKVFSFNPLVSLILTICLTLLVHSVGLSLASFIVRIFTRYRMLVFVVFTSLVAVAFASTLNIIIPQNFGLLYQSPAESFFTLTNTLPVTKSPIYQYLLDPGQPVVSTAVIFIFSFSFVLLSLVFQSLSIRHNLAVTNSLNIKPSYVSLSFLRTKLPITKKDILFLARKPQEVINVFFFLTGGIVITFLIQNLRNIRPFTQTEAHTIGLFAFGWYSFFAISYCLRFVLPLLSIEGGSLSLLLVGGRSKMFAQKLISTVVITIPLLLSSLLLWYFFRLPIEKSSYIIASFKLILFSSMLAFFQGWLYPDFKDSQSPDRVSTSLSGLLVLVASLGYLFVQYLNLADSQYWEPLIEIVPIALLLILGFAAKNKNLTLE